jgi:hypothetical protein
LAGHVGFTGTESGWTVAGQWLDSGWTMYCARYISSDIQDFKVRTSEIPKWQLPGLPGEPMAE